MILSLKPLNITTHFSYAFIIAKVPINNDAKGMTINKNTQRLIILLTNLFPLESLSQND